jgi:hypothetical protein
MLSSVSAADSRQRSAAAGRTGKIGPEHSGGGSRGFGAVVVAVERDRRGSLVDGGRDRAVPESTWWSSRAFPGASSALAGAEALDVLGAVTDARRVVQQDSGDFLIRTDLPSAGNVTRRTHVSAFTRSDQGKCKAWAMRRPAVHNYVPAAVSVFDRDGSAGTQRARSRAPASARERRPTRCGLDPALRSIPLTS